MVGNLCWINTDVQIHIGSTPPSNRMLARLVALFWRFCWRSQPPDNITTKILLVTSQHPGWGGGNPTDIHWVVVSNTCFLLFTVDGKKIRLPTWYCWWFRNLANHLGCKRPVVYIYIYNGINYQPELVSRISEPSTAFKISHDVQ